MKSISSVHQWKLHYAIDSCRFPLPTVLTQACNTFKVSMYLFVYSGSHWQIMVILSHKILLWFLHCQFSKACKHMINCCWLQGDVHVSHFRGKGETQRHALPPSERMSLSILHGMDLNMYWSCHTLCWIKTEYYQKYLSDSGIYISF